MPSRHVRPDDRHGVCLRRPVRGDNVAGPHVAGAWRGAPAGWQVTDSIPGLQIAVVTAEDPTAAAMGWARRPEAVALVCVTAAGHRAAGLALTIGTHLATARPGNVAVIVSPTRPARPEGMVLLPHPVTAFDAGRAQEPGTTIVWELTTPTAAAEILRLPEPDAARAAAWLAGHEPALRAVHALTAAGLLPDTPAGRQMTDATGGGLTVDVAAHHTALIAALHSHKRARR